MKPLVSVILPCYNAEATIVSAICSIVNQTFRDWELIVVDDASSDGSLMAINSIHDHRIKLIKRKDNGGYPVAMNDGLMHAKGEWVARMDADDICLPKRLEKQLMALSENDSASICGTNRFRITPGGKCYVDSGYESKPTVIWETWDDLVNGKRIFTDASVMLRREQIFQVGCYRTYQRSGMDVDLWLRIMERFGPGITLTEALYGRLLDPGSLVFNPETALINQVPRILAQQRRARGHDDVMLGKGVRFDAYFEHGDLRKVDAFESSAILIGASVTCFWFGDRIGFQRYFFKAFLSVSGIGGKIRVTLLFCRKLIGRFVNNPYKRFFKDIGDT